MEVRTKPRLRLLMAPQSSCLEDDEALEFLEGTLTPAQAVRVERHLGECTSCRRLLVFLVQASVGSSRSGPSPRANEGGPRRLEEERTVVLARRAAERSFVGPGDPMEGTRVGNFVISRRLGEGGMGRVYLAVHPEIGRQVAVKVLSLSPSRVPQVVQRFLVEAKIIAHLRHPNIVEIHDFGQLEDGRPFYIMEALHGRTLTEIIREAAPMSPAACWSYLRQICGGLHAAHEQGVVHRDLKPSNVFVLDGEPMMLKLLDFGLAKRVGAWGSEAELTRPGQVLGTPLFMAPEQASARPEQVDARSDVFALGVILYWMLAGELPGKGKGRALPGAAPTETAGPALQERVPGIPAPIATLVTRCLEPHPERRPASAQLVASLFFEAMGAGSRSIETSDSARAVAHQDPVGHFRLWVWMVAAGLLAASGGVWFAVRGAGPDPRPGEIRAPARARTAPDAGATANRSDAAVDGPQLDRGVTDAVAQQLADTAPSRKVAPRRDAKRHGPGRLAKPRPVHRRARDPARRPEEVGQGTLPL